MPAPQLNFDRAQYHDETPPAQRCAWCGRVLVDQYFLANGTMICGPCAVQASTSFAQDTRERFVRALLAGSLAAVVCALALALLITLLPGATGGWAELIGAIVAAVVIARAMKQGSQGVGGRRYQWAGALLLYGAIMVGQVVSIAHNLPVWAYPLLPLAPLLLLATGQFRLAAFMLFLFVLAVRWTWLPLRPNTLRLEGPKPLAETPQAR